MSIPPPKSTPVVYLTTVELPKPLAVGVQHLAASSCGPELADLTMGHLASLHRQPDHFLRDMVETECPGRPGESGGRIPCPKEERFMCERWAAGITACDTCRKAALDEETMRRAKAHWESICPGMYRETDRNHVDFPRAQYNQLRDWVGSEPLFFYGDTGSGKTRLAFLMLKRAMLRANAHVGVMWPRELKDAAKAIDQSARVVAWSMFDVLLIDDPFRDGANERVVSLLVDLVDELMKHKKRFIVTSQLNGDDCREHIEKYLESGRKPTETDIKRLEALWRRFREACRVVPFAKASAPAATAGEPAEIF